MQNGQQPMMSPMEQHPLLAEQQQAQVGVRPQMCFVLFFLVVGGLGGVGLMLKGTDGDDKADTPSAAPEVNISNISTTFLEKKPTVSTTGAANSSVELAPAQPNVELAPAQPSSVSANATPAASTSAEATTAAATTAAPTTGPPNKSKVIAIEDAVAEEISTAAPTEAPAIATATTQAETTTASSEAPAIAVATTEAETTVAPVIAIATAEAEATSASPTTESIEVQATTAAPSGNASGAMTISTADE